MIENKKGKGDGSSVAVILIVIALFMVLYILFIPPEERRGLLDSDRENVTSSSASSAKLELLAESPGIISPTRDFGTKHSIPSVNIFIKTEPKLDQLAQNIVVKNGLFTKSSPILKFRSDDFSDTKKVTLNFFVQQASGELRIKLNGQTVYSEDIVSSGAKVVDINKNFLRDQNELEFSVSSAFFSVNTYNLQNLVLKQEFERINSKEERSFTLSDGELKTMSRARLEYTQVCNDPLPKDTARLDIHVNDLRAITQNIKCVTTNQELDIDLNYLRVGKNVITFTLEEGDFSLNQLNLETTSSESKFLTYAFSLPSSEFDKIESNEKKVSLDLALSQERRKKNARIIINNNEVIMNTEEGDFSRDITDLVVEGTNFLRIIPSNSFLINSLKVTLEDS